MKSTLLSDNVGNTVESLRSSVLYPFTFYQPPKPIIDLILTHKEDVYNRIAQNYNALEISEDDRRIGLSVSNLSNNGFEVNYDNAGFPSIKRMGEQCNAFTFDATIRSNEKQRRSSGYISDKPTYINDSDVQVDPYSISDFLSWITLQQTFYKTGTIDRLFSQFGIKKDSEYALYLWDKGVYCFMNEMVIGSSKGSIWTSGLGPCVGISAYDSVNKYGLIQHISAADKCYETIEKSWNLLISRGAISENIKVGLFGGEDQQDTVDISSIKDYFYKVGANIVQDFTGDEVSALLLNLDSGKVDCRLDNGQQIIF
jgi:chemotaxis receptor (MCP) glutamine deamidase CheD